MFKLKTTTSPDWVNTVLDDFDQFLQDHAACERKASAMAMSMVAHYPDKKDLVSTLIDIAIEELNHFKQVMKLLQARDITPGPDEKDPYIAALLPLIRNGRDHYFLDRLIVASIVEHRGYERFQLIADALEPGALKSFYQGIARSEQRHYEVFITLAKQYFPEDTVMTRLDELLIQEADIVDNLMLRAALH